MRLTRAQVVTWSQRSANRSMLVAASVVALMTVGVKLAALVKDLLVAQNFGVGRELDAYFVAFILPQFAISVIAGAFHTSLVPTYIEVRQQQGEAAAQELLSAITARALLALTVAAVVLAVVGPSLLPIIGSGFDAHTMALARTMFYLTLPAVIISGMGVIWGAVLNSHERFALAALAPLAVPVMTMILMLLLRESLGIYTLALGLVTGFSVQALLLGASLRQRRLGLRPVWRSSQVAAIRKVMEQFLPAVAAGVLATGTELVDQSMATPLGAGSVSAINYAMKLLSFMVAIGATGLSVSALTYFSKLVAVRDWDQLKHTYKTYALLILAATLPVVVVFLIFSEDIIRLVYQRGAFTAEDTVLVAQIQRAFVLQLPIYLLITMTGRVLSALKMQSVFFWAAGINLISNIILNLVFIRWFGVAGIALSTSAVQAISLVFLFLLLWRRLRRVDDRVEHERKH